ncbi:phosphatidylinositol glycan anchor biosynthesis class C [Oratosquilla oratoria]|uniref:phosphatidylinositol glycan anchor biosynthesis class C n=1 Tax=Oratosquilla oratoria TaxID=337810 RepID=UPI003F766C6F
MEEDCWERVLWKKQKFPDNYVGESFLRVRKKRLEVTYSQAIFHATVVSQEICSCLGLVAVFFALAQGRVTSTVVLSVTGALILLGYLITHSNTALPRSVKSDAKVVCFYCILIACASPIVKTLTASVATDTINACTTALLVLRLIHQDYGVSVAIVNPTIAHNLGMFAAVCLASRLHQDKDVFTLITVAVALFALYPGFRSHVQRKYSDTVVVVLTLVVFLTTLVSLWLYAEGLAGLLLVSVGLCNGLVPVLFVYLQDHKQNIYGPWDEAQIEDKDEKED